MTIEPTHPPATVNGSEAVIRLAREVSGRIAPEESGIFDQVATVWRAGLAQRRAPGGGVGFGIEDALVSAIVIEVVAASILDVLRLGASTVRSRWRRWRVRGRRRPSASELDRAALPAVDGRVVLTAAQVARLRSVARGHAMTLGLDEATADLLADALVGAVHLDTAPPDDTHP
ncbi:hypothetical protein [Verrucosispora sp. WMMD1129]|uniref:hypothetical protein n=1 Tax=Verrucosispora sp. WMMD1129 TaxID=3016093 RepID=UPI00249BCBEC|nr:hypothetical protein [Verrucosispora sp. WMMD1129]WFE48211.1 hypothetical protein O7624_29570 [Verrucosispora sp. WMMD1129]